MNGIITVGNSSPLDLCMLMTATASDVRSVSTGYVVGLPSISSSIIEMRSEMVSNESRCAPESTLMTDWETSLSMPYQTKMLVRSSVILRLLA